MRATPWSTGCRPCEASAAEEDRSVRLLSRMTRQSVYYRVGPFILVWVRLFSRSWLIVARCKDMYARRERAMAMRVTPWSSGCRPCEASEREDALWTVLLFSYRSVYFRVGPFIFEVLIKNGSVQRHVSNRRLHHPREASGRRQPYTVHPKPESRIPKDRGRVPQGLRFSKLSGISWFSGEMMTSQGRAARIVKLLLPPRTCSKVVGAPKDGIS